VMALLAVAVSKALNLQIHTSVHSISETPDSDGYWPVQTSRGIIKASKAVVTNYYTAGIAPRYASRIIPPAASAAPSSSLHLNLQPLSSSYANFHIHHLRPQRPNQLPNPSPRYPLYRWRRALRLCPLPLTLVPHRRRLLLNPTCSHGFRQLHAAALSQLGTQRRHHGHRTGGYHGLCL
jgi:hypothetical protein